MSKFIQKTIYSSDINVNVSSTGNIYNIDIPINLSTTLESGDSIIFSTTWGSNSNASVISGFDILINNQKTLENQSITTGVDNSGNILGYTGNYNVLWNPQGQAGITNFLKTITNLNYNSNISLRFYNPINKYIETGFYFASSSRTWNPSSFTTTTILITGNFQFQSGQSYTFVHQITGSINYGYPNTVYGMPISVYASGISGSTQFIGYANNASTGINFTWNNQEQSGSILYQYPAIAGGGTTIATLLFGQISLTQLNFNKSGSANLYVIISKDFPNYLSENVPGLPLNRQTPPLLEQDVSGDYVYNISIRMPESLEIFPSNLKISNLGLNELNLLIPYQGPVVNYLNIQNLLKQSGTFYINNLSEGVNITYSGITGQSGVLTIFESKYLIGNEEYYQINDVSGQFDGTYGWYGDLVSGAKVLKNTSDEYIICYNSYTGNFVNNKWNLWLNIEDQYPVAYWSGNINNFPTGLSQSGNLVLEKKYESLVIDPILNVNDSGRYVFAKSGDSNIISYKKEIYDGFTGTYYFQMTYNGD